MAYTLTPYYDFFGHSVDASIELDFLREFVDSLNRLLAEAAARSPSQRRPLPVSVAVIASDRAGLYSELFPQLVHESFAISSVVFLERECRSYVECLRRALAASLTLNDLSGTVLERFKRYSEKVCSLDLGLAPEDWQGVAGLVALRTCLVHSSGVLEGSRDKTQIKWFVRRYRTPEVVDGRLVCSASTSELCLRILTRFTDVIYDAALHRFPEEA